MTNVQLFQGHNLEQAIVHSFSTQATIQFNTSLLPSAEMTEKYVRFHFNS